MNETNFEDTFEYKIIYVVAIPDEAHKGLLKVGETTYPAEKIYFVKDNCEELNRCAEKRIKQWTGTAGLEYKLLYTALAVRKNNTGFGDTDVHDVLRNAGYNNVRIGTGKEWFRCDLETIKNAIFAVREGRKQLFPGEISQNKTPVILRPEQEEAVNLAINHFNKFSSEQAHFLWNAKMRFGKTISALEVAKRMGFQKTIIVTHRPVVKKSWYDDFKKVFYDSNEHQYGNRGGDRNLRYLLSGLNKHGIKFVYFASMQDLRGSSTVGGKFDKNDEVFNTSWDFVIIDEAHEGTQTSLGDEVLESLITSSSNTKALYLSGTPFNLLSSESNVIFKEEEVYTWDYISEQKAKLEWVEKHFGDSNPYESLPKMNIYTYNLREIIKSSKFIDIVDEAFSFKEFFRTWTEDDVRNPRHVNERVVVGDFVHEKDVLRFLDLLVETGNHNYPFSTNDYRSNFRHTLWMVPGVKEARALSALLKRHRVFRHFTIVNVAGSGDEEESMNDALEKVQKAIGKNPSENYTITLSCGRLTTGVTVPEWTACLMLAGSNTTSASSYLQTIFRVQSPANIAGKVKTNCYVFDFAPDRTLKIVAEASNLSIKPGDTRSDKTRIGEFLNFCPVIGYNGSSMTRYSTENMLTQLKKVYIDRVVRNGFDDDNLYNDHLRELTDEEIEKFNHLNNIVKAGKEPNQKNEITINDQGMDNEIHEELEPVKPKKELTEEELAAKKEKERRARERLKALRTLRAISRRIPLMIYGADVDIKKEINVDEFVELVDEESWKEFMPTGVTKNLFREFIKYFDQDIFAGAGLVIRRKAKAADELPPLERVQAITDIFKTFKNPDRETVLTPWNVVNLHMGECLGGANFYTENGHEPIIIDDNTSPRWIESKLSGLTNSVFNTDSKIIEINSKSGLYPLYAAISIYQNAFNRGYRRDKEALWSEIVENNIYVICRTKMAASITRRTLRGFDANQITNIIVISDIVKQMSEEYKYAPRYDELVCKINSGKIWGKGDITMKFNAVIGNPPYQSDSKQQIYTDFYLLGREIGDIVSMIFPTGWQKPKDKNNLQKLNNEEIKRDKQVVFIDNRQNIFPGIVGAEWTNFILWKKGYDNKLGGAQRVFTNGVNETLTIFPIYENEVTKEQEIVDLYRCVETNSYFESMMSQVSSLKPYGLRTYFFDDQRELPPVKINNKEFEGSIKIYGIYQKHRAYSYVSSSYPLPKKTKSFKKYKVFIGKAWGGFDNDRGLGGTYADIIIAKPYEICTENYLEVGCFDTFEEAKKMAKYLMTRFLRALLYLNKFSQDNSSQKFKFVPTQDFTEEWWEESIDKIEDHLFDKYSVPEDIRNYVKKHIQKRSEANIENYK